MASLSRRVGSAFFGDFAGLREIQRESIGPVLDGDDVLVLSPTGSGKTEAVIAPLVQKYLADPRAASGPAILYVTPTRALANDLLRRLNRPLESLGLVAGIRHGERNDLQRVAKPDLLITTPESLDVMISSRESALADIQAVSLDEAHLLYNTQRGLQLSVLLHRLELLLERKVQVVALSATVATEAQMWSFLRPGRTLVTVRDRYTRPIDAQIRTMQTPKDLALLLEQLTISRKFKALIFARSRRDCDNLASALGDCRGLKDKVFVHHSSLSRELRLDVEKKMQDAHSAICVATSTLELGIDIGDVDLVIIYGAPANWESFLQRVGRGNRRGTKSNVLCLAFPGDEPNFKQLMCFQALLWQVQEHRLEQRPAMELCGAVAQQILSLLTERSGGYERTARLTDVFSPWPHLTSDVIRDVLDALENSDCLVSHGFLNRVGAGPRLHQLRDLGLIWGNFPATSSTIPLRASGRDLGTIPSINLARVKPGSLIRFAGRQWRVTQIRRDAIYLEIAAGGGNEVKISYGGHRPALDPSIVEAMLLLLLAGTVEPHMLAEEGKRFTRVAERLKLHLARDTLPVAIEGGRFLYFTFGGKLLNEVIALNSKSREYQAGEVVLQSADPIDFSQLPTDPHALLPIAIPLLADPAGLTVFQQLLPPRLLNRELGELWLKSPICARSIERLRLSTERPVQLKVLEEINF